MDTATARRIAATVGAAVAVLVLLGLDALRMVNQRISGATLVERQLAWLGVALLGAAAVWWLTPRVQTRVIPFLWGLCAAALVLVLFQPPVNGARSWFRFGGVSVQPAELAKPVVCATLAYLLARARPSMRLYALCALAVLVPVGTTVLQPDVGTAAVFFPIWLGTYVACGVPWRAVLLHLVAFFAVAVVAWPTLSAEQRARLVAFLNQRDLGPPPRDEGYQLHQAKRVVLAAGWTGNPEALNVHLPMAHNDFVFTLVVGHRGLAGAVVLVLAYGALLWGLTELACRHPDPFAAAYLVGLACWFGIQGGLNMAMNVGLAPITGITLPFVSYGGSSLVSCTLGTAYGLRLTLARLARPSPLLT